MSDMATVPDWKQFSEELDDARRILNKISNSLTLLSPVMFAMKTTDEKRQLATLIKAIVGVRYGVSEEDLVCRTRTERLAWPRQVAMALVREFTNLPLMAIGELFARDHGTVMHAIAHVEARCLTNARTAREVQEVRLLVRERVLS